MRSVAVVAFLLVVKVVYARNWNLDNLKIPFEDCGSQFELKKLSISTCSSIPCNVDSGSFVTFTAEFDASNSPYSAYGLKHEAYWIVDGITLIAVVDPSSCDKSANCPSVTTNGLLEFTSEVFVSKNLPKFNGILHFKTKNYYGDLLMCYKVPVSIH